VNVASRVDENEMHSWSRLQHEWGDALRRSSVRVAAAVLAVVLAPSVAAAQAPSPSLEEVQRELRRGDDIRLTHDGHVVDGRFDGFSGSLLRILRRGRAVDVPMADISRIRRRRHEPHGVWIGLGAGAAAGVGYVVLHCSGSSESGDCRRAGSVVMVGPSAVAGALIDRAVEKFDTLFERDATSATELRIAPIVTRGRTGVALTLTYR
jgi:hypothetical protein